MKKMAMITGGVFLLVACNQNNEIEDVAGDATNDMMSDEQEESVSSEVEESVIATNLESPWTIVVDEDRYFIPKREGTIYMVSSDGDVTEEVIELDEAVLQEGEGGLLGMVLDLDFANNGYAYVYHTYESDEGIENRIVQVTRHEEEGMWQEEMVLLDGIPGAATHNGGRLAFGPDDMLYATTGDAEVPDLSQDPDNLAGNILRMNIDGTVPDDNPFSDSPVYSYGHRNPQGLAWLDDGTLYSSEHGQIGNDEINLIEAGNNYGWPEIEGDEMMEGMEAPMIHSGEDTWAPSGLTMYQDHLYMAGLRGEAVFQFNPDNEEEIVAFIEDYGRIRDVHVEGDSLYFITNNTDGRGTPEADDDQLVRVDLN